MSKLDFILGERRKIYLEITSTDDADFLIRNATWEITKYNETLEQGECTIDGHTLVAMVEPDDRGQYSLIFTFEIGGELLKESVTINVK